MKERRYDIDWLRVLVMLAVFTAHVASVFTGPLTWHLNNFLIIAVASFALIMVLYELLIRRFNVVRFFFGMRPKKKPSATPAPRPEGTAA